MGEFVVLPDIKRRVGVVAGCDSREPGGAVRRYTSRIRKTHVTEVLEVLYPWHPWFGRQVYLHTIVERDDVRAFGCATDSQQTARCLSVPAWMFDRAACARMFRGEAPRAELAALVQLKVLLAEINERSSTASTMVGARHSFGNRGDVDAPPESSLSNRSTGSVSHDGGAPARLAPPVGRSTGAGDASARPDAERPAGPPAPRPRGRRAGR